MAGAPEDGAGPGLSAGAPQYGQGNSVFFPHDQQRRLTTCLERAVLNGWWSYQSYQRGPATRRCRVRGRGPASTAYRCPGTRLGLTLRNCSIFLDCTADPQSDFEYRNTQSSDCAIIPIPYETTGNPALLKVAHSRACTANLLLQLYRGGIRKA